MENVTLREYSLGLQEAAGSLMAASAVHTLLGLTGLVGFLTRFIGPATLVPALVLLCFDLVALYRKFAAVHWGVTVFTCSIVLIFSSYLGRVKLPLPAWNRERGWHVRWHKLLRPFALLIGMGAGWLLCFILTVSEEFPPGHKAATRGVTATVNKADWFYAPHPGQFGAPRFDAGLFFGFLVSVVASVWDSVADYYAAARICDVDKPPPHAINRGLFVEGLCSIRSGAFGAAHATSSNTGIVGEMAVSGVTSRRVFQLSGIILIVVGFIGKFSAFFITMPKPVIAGFSSVGVATLLGVVLSSLSEINMERPRNVISVGFPIIFGAMVSGWVGANPTKIDVGVHEVNQLFRSLLGNSMFVGGCLGFLLDNTLPGKRVSLGTKPSEKPTDEQKTSVYDLPYITGYLGRQTWTRYVPILPSGAAEVGSCGGQVTP